MRQNRNESALREKRRLHACEHCKNVPEMSRQNEMRCEPRGHKSKLSESGELRKLLKLRRRQKQKPCWQSLGKDSCNRRSTIWLSRHNENDMSLNAF